MRILPSLALLALLAPLSASAQPVEVRPSLETLPGTLASGNQPLDVALWVNPLDPGQSLLLVADASAGLITFTLDGREFQLVAEGVVSGVDVREGISVAGVPRPLVVTANRTLNGLVPYVIVGDRVVQRVDPNTVLRVGNFGPETVALYLSSATGRLYAFTGNNVGSNPTVVQLEMTFSEDGGVSATEVRRIALGSPATGLVADEEQGFLFIAERDRGISRVDAEPGPATTASLIASVTTGLLGTPVGGLGIYRAGGTAGYLLVANTSASTFNIYERQPPHGLVGTFQVGQGDGDLDPVTRPNTVEVTARNFGPGFPQGLVVAHDTSNAPENHKLVPWPSVANAFNPPLTIAGVTDGGTPDAGTDGGTIGLPGGGGPIGPTLPPDDPNGCDSSATSVSGLVLLTLLGLSRRWRRR